MEQVLCLSTMKPLFHPKPEDIMLETVLSALSDPARLRIVTLLAEKDELRCHELDLDLAASTTSHHCKILRESGVVRTRASGTERIMSLRKSDLAERFPGLLDAVIFAYKAKST